MLLTDAVVVADVVALDDVVALTDGAALGDAAALNDAVALACAGVRDGVRLGSRLPVIDCELRNNASKKRE